MQVFLPSAITYLEDSFILSYDSYFPSDKYFVIFFVRTSLKVLDIGQVTSIYCLKIKEHPCPDPLKYTHVHLRHQLSCFFVLPLLK